MLHNELIGNWITGILVATLLAIVLYAMIQQLRIVWEQVESSQQPGATTFQENADGDWVLTLKNDFKYIYERERNGLPLLGYAFIILGILLFPVLNQIHLGVAVGFFCLMVYLRVATARMARQIELILNGIKELRDRHLVVNTDGLYFSVALLANYRDEGRFFAEQPDSRRRAYHDLYLVRWEDILSFPVRPRWLTATYTISVKNHPFPVVLNRILIEPCEQAVFERLKVHLTDRFSESKVL